MLIMSIKNKIIWVLVVFVITVFLLQPLAAQEASDDILEFYQTRAGGVFDSRSPFESGLSFSLLGKTYYIVYDKAKNKSIKDSLIYRSYYSFGKIDSTIKVCKECMFPEELEMSTIFYPNVFDGSYLYNFFPNDTGGSDLAIGFDTKELIDSLPDGLALIDRERYFLKKLHLYFYKERRDRRESKSYRFTEHEGFIFPDSIWEIKAKRGIFSTEYYRLETSLTEFQIYR